MPVLTVSGIRKSFGTLDLLVGASFFINDRERAALIGANGSGKSTLLDIIAGVQTPDSGTAFKDPGVTVGYLPQDLGLPGTAKLHLAVMGVTDELLACAIKLDELQAKMHSGADNETASRFAELSHKFDTLHGFDYQLRARTILLGLGFGESDLDTPLHHLSGGQKVRAALARLLLLEPDLLLLDEPTNHLDIEASDWLQDYLNTRYRGAALIVSHDRYFLDRVVSKVIELEHGVTCMYSGNYTQFAEKKAQRLEERRRQYESQQKEIKRLEAAIQNLLSMNDLTMRDSKQKQLDRLERVGPVTEKKTLKLKLPGAARSGRQVLRLAGLSKSFPGKKLFSDVDFTVERGRKIGIVGPNGSGKSTMLNIIAGKEPADSGEVILGHNVVPVHFAQQFDHLVPTRTVLEELLADADITTGEARGLLARFLFLGDDAFKKVEMLSGGEQCRLALAKVLAKRPNLLLLDEPTNHLDIDSREALEQALQTFDGTVMIASHDRYLLDAVVGEIVEIRDSCFTHYLGNYTRYHEKTHPAKPESQRSGETGEVQRSQKPKERPLTSLREKEKLLRELSKRRRELEREIECAEERMEELTAALGNEETYRNGSAREISREYGELSEKLRGAYEAWEEVCEQISQAEAQSSGYIDQRE